jgi:AI-2 transport protein TqsA
VNDVYFSKPSRVIILATAFVVLTLAAREMREIVAPILFALFVTQAFGPIGGWLMSKGLPRTPATIAVIALIVLTGLVLIVVLGGSVASLNARLPTYKAHIDQVQANMQSTLDRFDISLSTDFLKSADITKIVSGIIAGIFNALSSVAVVLFIVAFMLFEAFGFRSKVERALGPTNTFLSSSADYTADIRSYVFIKVWLGALVAVIETVVLLALGVDFAILWGIISFLMSFIPNVGFIISLIPPVFMAFLEFGWEKALVVLAMYLIINTAVDNFITPRIMGRGLDLSPLVVFLSLMYWSFAFGALGAFLSVPLTLMVKRLLLERYEETRWLAVIIGSSAKDVLPAAAQEVAASAGESPVGS